MDNVVFQWLLGVIAVPVINWIKTKLNLQDEGAMLLTFAASVVLGIVYMFLTGEFFEINWADIADIAAKVLAAATLVYKLLWPLIKSGYQRLAGR